MESRRASPFDGAGLRPASPHTGSPAAIRSRCARSRRPVLNGLALRQSSSTTCSRHITTTCRSLPGVIRAALENIPGSPPWPVRAFRARRRRLGACRSRSRGASGLPLAILSASTPGSTPESFSRTIAGACILERAREWQRILLLLLRKSWAGFGDGRDKTPLPIGAAGVTPFTGGACFRGAGPGMKAQTSARRSD